MTVAHLADELDVLSLDLLHHHDLHFVEEVQGEVAQSVSVTGQFVVSIKHVTVHIQTGNRAHFSILCLFISSDISLLILIMSLNATFKIKLAVIVSSASQVGGTKTQGEEAKKVIQDVQTEK